MGAVIVIETPLGPLHVAVQAEGADDASPARRSRLLTGAEVLVWPDVGGVVVDALLTPCPPADEPATNLPPTEVWGLELRLYALGDTAGLTVSATLPDAAPAGSPASDEHLVALEFVTADWCLAIGGPDEERLAQLAEDGREPAAWRDMPAVSCESGRGIAWVLPAMRTAELARLHVAVAWCRAGHPGCQDAAWLAVDTSPSALRRAAGVSSGNEGRRAARGT